MELRTADPTIMIIIGHEGLAFALDSYNNLLVHHRNSSVSLDIGPLTQQRAKELGEYLQRLAILTPEK